MRRRLAQFVAPPLTPGTYVPMIGCQERCGGFAIPEPACIQPRNFDAGGLLRTTPPSLACMCVHSFGASAFHSLA